MGISVRKQGQLTGVLEGQAGVPDGRESGNNRRRSGHRWGLPRWLWQAGREGMVIGAWGNLALEELGAWGMGCSAMWCWPRVRAWMLSQWAKWEQELGVRLQLDGKTAPGAAGGQGSLGPGRERPAQRGGIGCTRARPSSRGGRKGPEECVRTGDLVGGPISREGAMASGFSAAPDTSPLPTGFVLCPLGVEVRHRMTRGLLRAPQLQAGGGVQEPS